MVFIAKHPWRYRYNSNDGSEHNTEAVEDVIDRVNRRMDDIRRIIRIIITYLLIITTS